MIKKEFSTGELGESILNKAIVENHFFHQWNEDIPKRIKIYNDISDDRSAALYLAIFVETELIRFIKLMFPDYNKYLGNQSFGGAINMIRAFKLIPDHILDGSNLIKNIRNEFAHDFDLLSFDQFNVSKPKLHSKLNLFYENYQDGFESISAEENDKYKYKTLCMRIISALRYYEDSIAKIRGILEAGKFNT